MERWSIIGKGRSHTGAYGNLVCTVAIAKNANDTFDAQVKKNLEMLDAHLREAGSARSHLLSLQIILTDIAKCPDFDLQWQEWIGPNPDHWPQRTCFPSGLAPGLLIEISAVAASIHA